MTHQPSAPSTYLAGRAQQVAINVLSPSYNSYLPPVLSSQLDKQGRQMIAFECKMCGIKINRPTLDSSCSNLIKHASNCLRKQSQSRLIESLAAVGIRGTGDIDPREFGALRPQDLSPCLLTLVTGPFST
ncbi:hypothetical protein MJO29_000020 [Puccinia striiformis f. sp. tritici]|nr:hypothetical protein MJO29_000020 [Puccinia striiformis f. sp. tritici]